MNNELTNEISSGRAERLLNMSNREITDCVVNALGMLCTQAPSALSGIDAENDNLTKPMWEAAVQTAEMTGMLVFPQFKHEVIPPMAEPVTLGIAANHVAERVASALLHLHGFFL